MRHPSNIHEMAADLAESVEVLCRKYAPRIDADADELINKLAEALFDPATKRRAARKENMPAPGPPAKGGKRVN